MEPRDFFKKLSEVAVYSKVEYSLSRGDAPRRRRDNSTEIPENPTLPVKVDQVKITPSVCELCGKVCRNGQFWERKKLFRADISHWRANCKVCDMVEDPWTGEMTCTPNQARYAWEEFMGSLKTNFLKKTNK